MLQLLLVFAAVDKAAQVLCKSAAELSGGHLLS